MAVVVRTAETIAERMIKTIIIANNFDQCLCLRTKSEF